MSENARKADRIIREGEAKGNSPATINRKLRAAGTGYVYKGQG